jgi:hypothetical protein
VRVTQPKSQSEVYVRRSSFPPGLIWRRFRRVQLPARHLIRGSNVPLQSVAEIARNQPPEPEFLRIQLPRTSRQARPDLPDHHCGGGEYGATGTGPPYVTGAVAHGSQAGAAG